MRLQCNFIKTRDKRLFYRPLKLKVVKVLQIELQLVIYKWLNNIARLSTRKIIFNLSKVAWNCEIRFAKDKIIFTACIRLSTLFDEFRGCSTAFANKNNDETANVAVELKFFLHGLVSQLEITILHGKSFLLRGFEVVCAGYLLEVMSTCFG